MRDVVGPDPPDTVLLVAARTLALDATTAEVATALQRAGLRCILLKGPSLARWLYDESSPRDYLDVDLLLSPAEFTAASDVLVQAGFEPSLAEVALPYGRVPHADTWVRGSNGLMVDLHRSLPGVSAAPESVWAELAADTEPMLVGGAEVEVLGKPARALLVALHSAHHGIKDDQALGDLVRAVAQLPEGTWVGAAALAERLEATLPLAAGLRLLPEGSALASRLGLPAESSVETILRAGSAPELALSLDWLLQAGGFRARSRLILRKLGPPASVLRGRSRLARRGRLGLAVSYLLQPLWLSWHAVPALRAWLGARKRIERT